MESEPTKSVPDLVPIHASDIQYGELGYLTSNVSTCRTHPQITAAQVDFPFLLDPTV